MPTMPYSSLGDAEGAAEILRVEIGGQSERRVVGHRHDLVLGLEAIDRRDRTEGLLIGHQHLGGDAREHGRLVEGAAQRMALAADHDLSRHERRHRRHGARPSRCALVDQRALHDADLDAVADLHLRDLAGEFRDELVMDAVLHEEAVGADAGLAHVAVLRGDRALTAASMSASSKTMKGALPPSSSPTFFTVEARLLHQQLADRRRAGEADEAHGRVAGHHAADRLARHR
jgi:hypothetical protein